MLSKSRKEAIEKGTKTYFTGKYCHRGHMDARYTANGECYTCREDRHMREKGEDCYVIDDGYFEREKKREDERKKKMIDYYQRNKERCDNIIRGMGLDPATPQWFQL